MRISIIGLGLIGGSIGLSLKNASNRQYEIIGYARKKATAEKALQMGAIDSIAGSYREAVESADMVFIATPVLSIHDIFSEISPYLQQGCIVTDVASTKTQVMAWAKELIPAHAHFIGGHPMAGKEQSGIEASDASLFHDRIYCLVYESNAEQSALHTVNKIINDLGAIALIIEADKHDLYVAGISHLPFIISVALATVTSSHEEWPDMSRLAATGYRDMTRLAAGSPDMYRDICLTNQRAISSWIDTYIDQLRHIQNHINTSDRDIYSIFEFARRMREKWWHSRKQ